METIELRAAGVHNDFWSGPDASYRHISAGVMANSTTKPQTYEVLLSQLLVTALASSDVMA